MKTFKNEFIEEHAINYIQKGQDYLKGVVSHYYRGAFLSTLVTLRVGNQIKKLQSLVTARALVVAGNKVEVIFPKTKKRFTIDSKSTLVKEPSSEDKKDGKREDDEKLDIKKDVKLDKEKDGKDEKLDGKDEEAKKTAPAKTPTRPPRTAR